MLSVEHVSKIYETRHGPYQGVRKRELRPAAGTEPRNSRPERCRQIHDDTADQRRRTAYAAGVFGEACAFHGPWHSPGHSLTT